MSASTLWVTLALLCMAQAQATPPAPRLAVAAQARPYGIAAPPRRPVTALRAEEEEDPSLEALDEQQKLEALRREKQVAQQKQEKKEKTEALDEMRVKAGRKAQADLDQQRRDQEAFLDKIRARSRKSKEEFLGPEDMAEVGDLLADEEAVELDRKYSDRLTDLQRKQIDDMIKEIDETMAAQRSKQLTRQDAQAADQEEDVLLRFERDAKNKALSDKIKAKKEQQERQAKLAGLEEVRAKEGKEAPNVKALRRKEAEKTITQKRAQARSAKSSGWGEDLQLLEEEQQALQELEEKYEQTQAALEVQRLTQRMEEMERLLEEERRQKSAEVGAILDAARARQGPTEEALLELEDKEVQRIVEEKVSTKQVLEERKEKREAVDKQRLEAGRPTEDVARERREKQKRITQARARMQATKEAAFTLEQPIEEDPFVDYLEREEVEMARAYARAQAEQSWADLRERVMRIKQQMAQPTAEPPTSAEADALMELEDQQRRQVAEEEARVQQLREDRQQKLQALSDRRRLEGKPGLEEFLERKQRQKVLAKARQGAGDEVVTAATMNDEEMEEAELIMLDEYYARTEEAASIATVERQVQEIEARLSKAEQTDEDDEDDDEDASGPSAGGRAGPSTASSPRDSRGGMTFSFGIVSAMAVALAAFLASVRPHRAAFATVQAPPKYYSV